MRRLSEEVVFLDTNVVMYAVGTEHPYRLPCQQVMSAVANCRGNLKEGVIGHTRFCELWLRDWYKFQLGRKLRFRTPQVPLRLRLHIAPRRGTI